MDDNTNSLSCNFPTPHKFIEILQHGDAPDSESNYRMGFKKGFCPTTNGL